MLNEYHRGLGKVTQSSINNIAKTFWWLIRIHSKAFKDSAADKIGSNHLSVLWKVLKWDHDETAACELVGVQEGVQWEVNGVGGKGVEEEELETLKEIRKWTANSWRHFLLSVLVDCC